MALEVLCVPVLSDNYVWVIHDEASGETVVVDPGEAQPVIDAVAAKGWTVSQIWNTHWHPDHTDGNAAVRDAAGGVPITGPAAEAAKIPTLDITVAEGDRVVIGDHSATVIEVPCHTAGHIAFHFEDQKLLFPGDTLFAMGCGRFFEGTPAQMYANMRRFEAMPDDTIAYGAHEYTTGNGKYAMAAEPDNQAIRDRMVDVDRLRAEGKPTLPTTIGAEKATNPFLRAESVEQMAERRAAKDSFKG